MKIEEVKDYILSLLNEKLDSKLYYHNIDHTLDVYNTAIMFSEREKISEYDQCHLLTAALFHDSGMLKTYEGHEDASVEVAKLTLPGFDYSKDEIYKICKIILATKPDVIPETICEKILKDADLNYLGRKDYFFIAQKLRLEWDIMNVNTFSLKEWYKFQITYLRNHKYFTKSANELREEQKIKNVEEIERLFG
ncbi:MAG: HD domain-containing protein [Bacteroidales bacterium]|nr:HD domain-containing protein [Bacteroidales bacterium]